MPPIRKLNCIHCGKPFTRVWPNANQRTCSRLCKRLSYNERNRAALNERSKKWARNNRERRLEIQRKWNASEKGQLSKRRWYEAHVSENVKKYLTRYRLDEVVRKLQQARLSSRRKLLKTDRPYVCERCGSMARLHCHHKDRDPFNRELSNLQWLCATCHGFAHSEAGLGE